MWGTRNYRYDTNQSQAWTFLRGIPTSITEYARPLIDSERLNAALGVYAQDRWSVNRLTLNLGLRFDYHNAQVPVQDLAAIPFVPARHYDAINNVPSWKDLSPRLGGTYDLLGNGKTILRAAYNKYVASESTNMATLNNRVNTSVNQATRNWTDTNGNFKPDCDLSNPAAQTVPGRRHVRTAQCAARQPQRRRRVRLGDYQRLRRSSQRPGGRGRRPAAGAPAGGAGLPVHASLRSATSSRRRTRRGRRRPTTRIA